MNPPLPPSNVTGSQVPTVDLVHPGMPPTTLAVHLKDRPVAQPSWPVCWPRRPTLSDVPPTAVTYGLDGG